MTDRIKIGLIDVDSHNFPNLALMKLSAWHKQNGDTVEWWNGFEHYDRVYMSKVFDSTYTADQFEPCNADEIIKGGTGYDLNNVLPKEIESIYPDYELYHDVYPQWNDTAIGFLTRGCPRHCSFCIVGDKEGLTSYKVADLEQFWRGQKKIELLDPNLLAAKGCEDLLLQLANSKAKVNMSQGVDARLLTKERVELLNRIKLDNIHFAWDNIADEDVVCRGLELYAKYATRKVSGAWGAVYVLTNFGSTTEEDLCRIYKLRDMGYDPYVMVYDKPNAPKITRRIQRWVNNRRLFKSCEKFEDYK